MTPLGFLVVAVAVSAPLWALAAARLGLPDAIVRDAAVAALVFDVMAALVLVGLVVSGPVR